MIARTAETTFLILALLFAFLAPYYPVAHLWGIGAGALLSVANLWGLHRILDGLLGGNRKRLLSLLFFKGFLFYGLIMAILMMAPLSIGAFVVGYVIPFGVLLLKLLGTEMNNRLFSVARAVK